jgi:hypothetical protein
VQRLARRASPGNASVGVRDVRRCRRLLVLAALAVAFTMTACGRAVVFASPIADGIEEMGMHLDAASILEFPPVTLENAELAARKSAGNGEAWQESRVTLVTVGGPGNPRVQWVPREHPLAYAVEWTAGGTIGLTLVDARTGEAFTIAH